MTDCIVWCFSPEYFSVFYRSGSSIKCKKLTFIYICVDSWFFFCFIQWGILLHCHLFSFFHRLFWCSDCLDLASKMCSDVTSPCPWTSAYLSLRTSLLSSTTPCSMFILYFSCLSPGIAYLPKDSWFLSVESGFYKISALGLLVDRLWFQALSVDRACMPVWYICVYVYVNVCVLKTLSSRWYFSFPLNIIGLSEVFSHYVCNSLPFIEKLGFHCP